MFSSSHRRERQKCLELLELPTNPTEEEIKKAYRKQALKYHPDKNPDKDTTETFQQIQCAYRFLTEGDNFLEQQMEDDGSDFFWIFHFMFPWLFKRTPERSSFFQRPNFNFFYGDDTSDESCEESYSAPRGTYTNTRYSTQGASNSSKPQQRRSNFENLYGQGFEDYQSEEPRYRNDPSRSTHHEFRPFYSQERPSESGASQHFRMYANFSETSKSHGEFYKDQSKRSAKRRRKNDKKARKEEADERQKVYTSAAHARAKSPDGWQQSKRAQATDHAEPSQSKARQAEKQHTPPPIRVEKGYNQPVEKEESKSKKEMKQEQKRREKEMREIREKLERDEKDKREKLERKKKAQEEKERKERERQEEEERRERERREEEQKKLEEERRIQREKEEKLRQERLQRERERREKQREQKEREEKMRSLMAEFDSVTLVDDNGEFKVTDSNIINLIRRDDLNNLRQTDNSKSNVEMINGVKTKDLIELQKAADKAKSTRESGEKSFRNLIQEEAQTNQHQNDSQRQSITGRNQGMRSAHQAEHKNSWLNHNQVTTADQQCTGFWQQQQLTNGFGPHQEPPPHYQQPSPQPYQTQHYLPWQQYGAPQQHYQAQQQYYVPPQQHAQTANPQAQAAAEPAHPHLLSGQPLFQFPPPLRPLNHRGLPRRGPHLPHARPQNFTGVSGFTGPYNQPLLNSRSTAVGVHLS